jgi:hypothetical protein
MALLGAMRGFLMFLAIFDVPFLSSSFILGHNFMSNIKQVLIIYKSLVVDFFFKFEVDGSHH